VVHPRGGLCMPQSTLPAALCVLRAASGSSGVAVGARSTCQAFEAADMSKSSSRGRERSSRAFWQLRPPGGHLVPPPPRYTRPMEARDPSKCRSHALASQGPAMLGQPAADAEHRGLALSS
jgi:hypothetical protein